MLKQFVAGIVCLALFQTSLMAGIGSNKAAYRGGTVAMKDGAEEKFSLVGDRFVFNPGKKKDTFEIPYDRIQTIEYGQKAGRRIGATAGLVMLAGPLGFLALMSKKRRHMVSVTWVNDQGKTDAAVIEFGKDAIRSALTSFEARSGKTVEYESEETKKNIGK
jgi:hypothetical protein